MKQNRFHKYFPTKGYNLHLILLAYLLAGFFYPVIGLLALICMIAPVAFAVSRGRWWCGNACPRGNMYDRLLAKYSPHRPIPAFVYIYRIRSTDAFCMGRLERDGTGVLEHYIHNDHSRHHSVVCLRTPHMVLVLPDGHTFGPGHT